MLKNILHKKETLGKKKTLFLLEIALAVAI